MGYPGHLWTQGFDYGAVETKLRNLMLGKPDWRDLARSLGVRYIFWGREENANYAQSTRPWQRTLKPIPAGQGSSIYDLEMPSPPRH